jgi:putative spermidine/putrescine transport system substrate-binding protein
MKRRPRYFVLGMIATLVVVVASGCSKSSSSDSGTDWATKTSASAGGGMDALIKDAKAEGTLNVIALPPDWANYGNIIKTFSTKYGIKVNSANPSGASQDEIDAVNQQQGTQAAPDVLDIGMAVAYPNTALFAPYQVATWSDIPADQKEASGLWYQDYGGYMAIGYDSAKYGTITSVDQLMDPKFKNAVALNGNPTEANAALNGVMMANLAQGGTADDISKGVDFFGQLAAAGNFSPVQATSDTVKAGTTPVVFDWDYLNATHGTDVPTWKVFVPDNAVLGGYYAQAINKDAPHPAAARLWEEFLFSQASDGGQNLWLQGGARPVEQTAMTSNGSLDTAAAANLPQVAGTPVFLDEKQATDAATYLSANWTKAVS